MTDIERLEDKVQGLEADLYEAVKVAYSRGAFGWARANYPAWIERLERDTGLVGYMDL